MQATPTVFKEDLPRSLSVIHFTGDGDDFPLTWKIFSIDHVFQRLPNIRNEENVFVEINRALMVDEE